MVEFNVNIISGSKTVGDAAYGEDEIQMPNSPRSGLLPAIVGIEIEHPPFLAASATTDQSKWVLSTKSNDAFPDFDDEEVVAMGKRDYCTIATANGTTQLVQDLIERVYFPAPIPISQDKLYLGVYGSHGGGTYRYRLLWVPRYVSGAKQRNSIMNQSTQF